MKPILNFKQLSRRQLSNSCHNWRVRRCGFWANIFVIQIKYILQFPIDAILTQKCQWNICILHYIRRISRLSLLKLPKNGMKCKLISMQEMILGILLILEHMFFFWNMNYNRNIVWKVFIRRMHFELIIIKILTNFWKQILEILNENILFYFLILD